LDSRSTLYLGKVKAVSSIALLKEGDVAIQRKSVVCRPFSAELKISPEAY